MRIDRGLLNWGVFLIALGGVPLAVQQGWVDASVVSDLWRLWPLILVGIGLGLILRWTPIAWLGGAMVAGTFGLIFGALLGSGISGISSACVGVGEGGAETTRSGAAIGAAFALDVELSCGDLHLVRDEGQSWSIDATHSADTPPSVEATPGRLAVRQDFSSDAFLVFTQETRNDWRVGLPADAALSVTMTLNAGAATVDLGGGPVAVLEGTYNASDVDLDLSGTVSLTPTRLDLTYNASSGRLALPAGPIGGEVTLNASSLLLCLPLGTPVRLEYRSTLGSDDLGSIGFDETDGVWTSPGYEAGSAGVELDIKSTVSSIDVEHAEVCQ